MTVPLLLAGLGIGALASQLGAVTVSAVPDELSPEVGGLQNTATNLGARHRYGSGRFDAHHRADDLVPAGRAGESRRSRNRSSRRPTSSSPAGCPSSPTSPSRTRSPGRGRPRRGRGRARRQPAGPRRRAALGAVGTRAARAGRVVRRSAGARPAGATERGGVATCDRIATGGYRLPLTGVGPAPPRAAIRAGGSPASAARRPRGSWWRAAARYQRVAAIATTHRETRRSRRRAGSCGAQTRQPWVLSREVLLDIAKGAPVLPIERHRRRATRSRASSRVIAASMSARWVKACGKLPICSPVRAISSEYRPTWLA